MEVKVRIIDVPKGVLYHHTRRMQQIAEALRLLATYIDKPIEHSGHGCKMLGTTLMTQRGVRIDMTVGHGVVIVKQSSLTGGK
jgi:hypothetical protein